MKKKSLNFVLFIFCSIFSQEIISQNLPTNSMGKEKQILENVLNLLKTKSIVKKEFNDAFSRKMYLTFLDSIDRSKLFLLQSDINEFKKYENKLDDQLKANDLSFFNLVASRLKIRMIEGKDIYTNLIKNKLNLTILEDAQYSKGSTNTVIENRKYCINDQEKTKRFNSFLKAWVFEYAKRLYPDNLETTLNFDTFDTFLENKQNNLFDDLEASYYNHESVNTDAFFEYYINAIVTQFDDYSQYYSSNNRNKYLRNITGRFEGTGVTVKQVNDFIEIKNVAVGGPAWKTKKIEIGDILLKVSQENEKPVNIVGLAIYDVTKLLRGKTGTVVNLTIKKKNGTVVEVSIKRDLVTDNDSYIKSCLIKKNKTTYGFINLLRFYNEFDGEKQRTTSEDFVQELDNFKQEKVEGIILDLRNNNLGSAEEAVKIISNFVPKNPVVQCKTNSGNVYSLNSENLKVNWNKKIIVLVNSKTSAAAEIIATSIKEYNVGIVIGQTTYGKGSTQEFIDLDLLLENKLEKKDLGALKISTQKLYTLGGVSYNKNPVIPDLDFYKNNTILKSIAIKESSTADKVKPIAFKAFNNNFSDCILTGQNSFNNNNVYIKMKKNNDTELEIYNQIQNIVTVNNKSFFTQFNKIIEKKLIDVILITPTKNEFLLTNTSSKLLKQKIYLIQKRNTWLANLQTDFEVEESINVIEKMTLTP